VQQNVVINFIDYFGYISDIFISQRSSYSKLFGETQYNKKFDDVMAKTWCIIFQLILHIYVSTSKTCMNMTVVSARIGLNNIFL